MIRIKDTENIKVTKKSLGSSYWDIIKYLSKSDTVEIRIQILVYRKENANLDRIYALYRTSLVTCADL